MIDALDFLNPKNRYTATGKFYAMRPDADPSGIVFNYEYVNPYSSTYKRLFQIFKERRAMWLSVQTI